MAQSRNGERRGSDWRMKRKRGGGGGVAAAVVAALAVFAVAMFACQSRYEPARKKRTAKAAESDASEKKPAAATRAGGLGWGEEEKSAKRPAEDGPVAVSLVSQDGKAPVASSVGAPAATKSGAAPDPAVADTLPMSGRSEAVAGGFGIAPSGECGRDLPRIFPLMGEAGVSMMRCFPEWPGIQPARGQWNFEGSDRLVKMARDSKIKLLGIFCYLTPWASSGGTRTFPIKDIQYWREYVQGVVTRYRNDIDHWEVYNEFNAGAFAKNGTPKDYAELVRNSYDVARKIKPDVKIGMGCASVAISFLEQVIKAGAGGHFDFVNVHPYELLSVAMGGREGVFLRMSSNIRDMLRNNGQSDNVEIWVSEVGWGVTDDPAKEREQAEAIAKVFVLSFAQGVSKVFYFEARGPYKMDLLRRDWSKRPSYHTLQLMTRLLGAQPKPLGWYNPTNKSYGFLLQGAAEPVLVMWAMKDEGDVVRFDGDVTVRDVAGKASGVSAGRDVRLTRSPVFVTGLPGKLVAEMRTNGEAPFPWMKDFSTAESVNVHAGAENVENGVSLLKWGDGKTVAELVDGIHVRRSGKRMGSNYIYFDVDDSYAGVGDNTLEITVVARRTDQSKRCSFNVCYESVKNYRGTKDHFDVPAGGWHRHTFRVNDANFGNTWGWNFRIDLCGSASDVYVKEVIVKRVGAKK